jgi:hypothetical protein
MEPDTTDVRPARVVAMRMLSILSSGGDRKCTLKGCRDEEFVAMKCQHVCSFEITLRAKKRILCSSIEIA